MSDTPVELVPTDEAPEYTDLRTIPDDVYRETMEEFTRSYGYHLFCSELYAMSENINDLQNVSNNDDLNYKKGQLAIIGFILNYQSIMEQSDAQSAE